MRTILLAVFLTVLSQSASAFYAPGEGRWLSRDPIEEEGGLNLYGFVVNDPLAQNDALGLRISAVAVRAGDPSSRGIIVALDKHYTKSVENTTRYESDKGCANWRVDGNADVYLDGPEPQLDTRWARIYPIAESTAVGDTTIIAQYSDGTEDRESITVIRPRHLSREWDGTAPTTVMQYGRAYTKASLCIYDQLGRAFPPGVLVAETVAGLDTKNVHDGGLLLGTAWTNARGRITDTYSVAWERLAGNGYFLANQVISVGNWNADVRIVLALWTVDAHSYQGVGGTTAAFFK